MDFLSRESDSDYAFRLQMEEALAASLSFRSRTPQRPPSPPIVARCGIAIIEENDQNESTAKTDSADVRLRNRSYGIDFSKVVGEGNSKGKCKIHETVTGVRRDDQNTNSRDTSGNGNMRLSLVIQSEGTVRPVQSVGEGSSRVNAAAGKFNDNVLYRLYFKGLVSDENGKGKMTDVLAGFGVAICDQRDNLLFEMKGPLIDNGMNRQAAELKALIRGLNEALKFGIKHIAICCDSYPIFQYVSFPPLCSSL